MGFGLLFYGFLMMIELQVPTSATYSLGVDIFPDLAGYLLMLTAACRLAAYAKGFERFRKALFPLIAVGIVAYGVGILSVFDVNPALLVQITYGVKYATMVLQPIAFFFLFAGMISLSAEVGLPSIASQTKLLAGLGAAYYAAQLVFSLTSDLSSVFTASFSGFIRYLLMIVWYIFVIFAEVELFRCYMYICYEGEERITKEDAINPFAKLFKNLKKGKGGR